MHEIGKLGCLIGLWHKEVLELLLQVLLETGLDGVLFWRLFFLGALSEFVAFFLVIFELFIVLQLLLVLGHFTQCQQLLKVHKHTREPHPSSSTQYHIF